MLTVDVFLSCRRPAVLLLAVYRAGPEDMQGPGRAWLPGDQHLGDSAAGPRRATHDAAVARLWPRALGAH